MQRQGKQSEIYRNEILQMSISTNEERNVKHTELKYCRCQYAETRKESKIQNSNTADVNTQRRSKQVKYTKLKYCRCQYAEIKKAKSNMQNWNTADANMLRKGKQIKIQTIKIPKMSIWRDDANKLKYRSEILRMSMWTEEESKVKDTELKYDRCQ